MSSKGMLSRGKSSAEFHRFVTSSGPILRAVLSAAGPEDLANVCAATMHILWTYQTDRLITSVLTRTCIQQDMSSSFSAGGSESLASETYSMRLLMEYQRLYGLDFLKKFLHDPLQKVSSGKYNEDFKSRGAIVPVLDILSDMLTVERELPGPVHDCMLSAFHLGEAQGSGMGHRAVSFIYLELFIFPAMRNPSILGITPSADYQAHIVRMQDAWLKAVNAENPLSISPKSTPGSAAPQPAAEEGITLCSRRLKRFYEGVLARLPKRESKEKEKDKKKRLPNADQLTVVTQFCRAKEEVICRSLLSLEFGELTAHNFRLLLSAEPETESLRSSKKLGRKLEKAESLEHSVLSVVLQSWAQRWAIEKQHWKKCYVTLTATCVRLQDAETASDKDTLIEVRSLFEVRELDENRLAVQTAGGRREYQLRFAEKKDMLLWKAHIGETRRIATTDLNPAVLLDLKDIETGTVVARGGDGTIYKGMLRGTVPAAIKTVAAFTMDQKGQRVENFPKDILILGYPMLQSRDSATLSLLCAAKSSSQLDHPNVLPLLGYGRRPDEFVLVTPFIDLGNLSDLLAKDRTPFTDSLICTFGAEIASGMAHVHSRGLLHRDLKTQNLLVKSLDPCAPVHVLIADFGTARALDEEEVFTKNPGTLVYEAPETHSGIYDEKVDVYSCGMCVWEMYSGQLPWAGEKWTAQILQKVVNGERPPFPANCPESVRRIIHACWNTDPQERPSFATLTDNFRALRNQMAPPRSEARPSSLLRGSTMSSIPVSSSTSEINLARVLAARHVSDAAPLTTSASLDSESFLAAYETISFGPPASRSRSSTPSLPSTLRSWTALLNAAGFEPAVVELYSAAWAAVPVPRSYAEVPFEELKEIEGTRPSHLKKLRKWIAAQQSQLPA